MKKLIKSTTLLAASVSLLFAFTGCGDSTDQNGGGNGGGDNGGGSQMACLQSCESASDCGGGDESKWACDNGACKPDECSSDSDCEGDSTVCEGNLCLPESAVSDGDGEQASCEDITCQNGGECQDGACVCSEGDCNDGFTCASP